jgi:hypothetical protein
MVTLNLLSDVALIREPLTFEAGIYFVCIACIFVRLLKKKRKELFCEDVKPFKQAYAKHKTQSDGC